MILNTIHNEKSENKNMVETFFRKKQYKKLIHRTKSANRWRNTQFKCKYKSFFDKNKEHPITSKSETQHFNLSYIFS